MVDQIMKNYIWILTELQWKWIRGNINNNIYFLICLTVINNNCIISMQSRVDQRCLVYSKMFSNLEYCILVQNILIEWLPGRNINNFHISTAVVVPASELVCFRYIRVQSDHWARQTRQRFAAIELWQTGSLWHYDQVFIDCQLYSLVVALVKQQLRARIASRGFEPTGRRGIDKGRRFCKMLSWKIWSPTQT